MPVKITTTKNNSNNSQLKFSGESSEKYLVCNIFSSKQKQKNNNNNNNNNSQGNWVIG